jgi:hypothetical protein
MLMVTCFLLLKRSTGDINLVVSFSARFAQSTATIYFVHFFGNAKTIIPIHSNIRTVQLHYRTLLHVPRRC